MSAGAIQDELGLTHGGVQLSTLARTFLDLGEDVLGHLNERVRHRSDGLRQQRGRLHRTHDLTCRLSRVGRHLLQHVVGRAGDRLVGLGSLERLRHHPPLDDRQLHGGDGEPDSLVELLGHTNVQDTHHAHLRRRSPGDPQPALVLTDLHVHLEDQVGVALLELGVLVAGGRVIRRDGGHLLPRLLGDALHDGDRRDQLEDRNLVLAVELIEVRDVPHGLHLVLVQVLEDLLQLGVDGLHVDEHRLDVVAALAEPLLDEAALPLVVRLLALGGVEVVPALEGLRGEGELAHDVPDEPGVVGRQLTHEAVDETVDPLERRLPVVHENLGVVQHLRQELGGLGLDLGELRRWDHVLTDDTTAGLGGLADGRQSRRDGLLRLRGNLQGRGLRGGAGDFELQWGGHRPASFSWVGM